jgi:hypothetical protein
MARGLGAVGDPGRCVVGGERGQHGHLPRPRERVDWRREGKLPDGPSTLPPERLWAWFAGPDSRLELGSIYGTSHVARVSETDVRACPRKPRRIVWSCWRRNGSGQCLSGVLASGAILALYGFEQPADAGLADATATLYVGSGLLYTNQAPARSGFLAISSNKEDRLSNCA